MLYIKEGYQKIKYRHLFIGTLLGIAFTMPINITANNIFIILLAVLWIFDRNKDFSSFNIKNNLPAAFLIFFYLLHLIGFLYSDNQVKGGSHLIKKLSFLFLPLIITSSSVIKRHHIVMVLNYFLLGCLLATFICLSYAFYQFYFNLKIDFGIPALSSYVNKSSFYYFSYSNLSAALNFHPIYFSLYLVFCISFLFTQIWNSLENKKNNFIRLGIILYLTLFVFLLAARLEIIILFFLLGFFILKFAIRARKVKLGICFLFASAILAGMVILTNPITRERFAEAFNLESKGYLTDNWGGRSIRLFKWKFSWMAIKDNFIFGTGTGNEQVVLNKYQAENLGGDYFYDTNAHNQYLQTWLSLGIPGISTLVLILLLAFKTGLRRKDLILLIFLSSFIFACITESIIEANKGIIYFAFFLPLLSIHPNKKPEGNN